MVRRKKSKKSNWNWNRDFEWKKESRNEFDKCYKCKENIESGEERYIQNTRGSLGSRRYCLECGREEQREVDINANEILKKLTSELAIIKQKEINFLTINNEKKIEEIKKEINLLSRKNLENPLNTASVKLLKNSLQELEQEINNPVPASSKPQNNLDNPAPTSPNNQQNEEETPQFPSAPKPSENKPQPTPQNNQQETPSNNQSPTAEIDSKNNWIKPVIIMGGMVLVIGLIIYLISKNKKNER